MTQSQKLELRRSEIRSRLAELAAMDEPTAEQLGEIDTLRSEYSATEVQLRAAVTAEAEQREAAAEGFEANGETGEGAELRAIRDRVRIRDYLAAATGGVAVHGAAAEYNAALDLDVIGADGGTAVPWAALAGPETRGAGGEAETRASTTTAALDGGTAQRPILQRLFGSKGVLEALGVRIDAVPVGKSEWPLLTGGVAPAQTAEDAAAPAAVTGVFTTATLKPKRLAGRYELTREAMAEVTGLEAGLRRDLAAAVEAQMCDTLINGVAPDPADSATAHRVAGFLSKLAAPNPAPSAAPAYNVAAAWGAQAVDGLHASMESEARIVTGTEGYRTLAAIVGNGADESVTTALGRRTGGLMASPFVPVPAADVQPVIVHGAGPNGGGMMRGDSVAAMWPTLSLVRDIYSKAAEGAIVLTWTALWDAAVAFRTGAYTRLSLFTG